MQVKFGISRDIINKRRFSLIKLLALILLHMQKPCSGGNNDIVSDILEQLR